MSPKFNTQILNNHLPSRIGCVLLLLSLLVYFIASVAPVLGGASGLPISLWPQTLGCLLLLLLGGFPALQYAWRGALG